MTKLIQLEIDKRWSYQSCKKCWNKVQAARKNYYYNNCDKMVVAVSMYKFVYTVMIQIQTMIIIFHYSN